MGAADDDRRPLVALLCFAGLRISEALALTWADVDLDRRALHVNIAIVGGRIAGWSALGYSAAKAAVIQATRCAAVELGETGVRANSISPGPILTGIFGKSAGLEPGGGGSPRR